MAVNIKKSEQFEQFVSFAKLAMAEGKTKAVARQSLEAEGKKPEIRPIVSTATDRAFAMRRTSIDKTANNATRDLFKAAIAEMYGGEKNIPKAVKAAMLTKDYGAGKPLTARRIMAVKAAIDRSQEPAIAKITLAKAQELVAGAVEYVSDLVAKLPKKGAMPEVDLLEEEKRAAARLLVKYGRNMTETGLKLLANNIVAIFATKIDAPETATKNAAADIRKFRNFFAGDTRMKEVDAKLLEYSRHLLSEQMGEEKSDMYDKDGVFESFAKDANRADFNICGKTFAKNGHPNDPLAPVKEFNAKIKGERKRMALSTFLCQVVGSLNTSLDRNVPFPVTPGFQKDFVFNKLKGGEMIVSAEVGDMSVYMCGRLKTDDIIYTLDAAKDGKSAKITVTSRGGVVLALSAADDYAQYPTGRFEQTFEFDFDLAGKEPELKDVRFAQSIEA